MKTVPPTVRKSDFSCPYCCAHAAQSWFRVQASRMPKGEFPSIVSEADYESVNFSAIEEDELREEFQKWSKLKLSGMPFFGKVGEYSEFVVENTSISECYNCGKLTIWLCDTILYPKTARAEPANSDMPEDVRRDYDEAGAILHLSPRGAAALLRLAMQKLCKHLGQSGENINKDIAALVKQGIDTRIQKALDIVRVIGNNAVHPGQIDIMDDHAIASTLFKLINLVVEKTISEPQRLDEIYKTLPDSSLSAIEKRDRPL